MSGNTSNEEQEKERSYIHVEFEKVGSSDPSISIQNITPNQIMGVVGYLETYAKTFYSGQIAQSLQKQKDQDLSVPKPEIEIAK